MIKPGMQLRLVVGLVLAIVLDTATQTLWKIGAADIPANVSLWDTLDSVANQTVFQIVGILMICKLINWLKVLEVADLSYIKPVMSLSYVTVSIASVVVLHEQMHWPQIIGILIVVAGVWLVSREPAHIEEVAAS